ncbi:Na/Pi cotransporter family protein [Thalassospira sp. GB04J01]|uniref:Na/Pi cotransporter family protein n=1 Tax=Thalassospira sp. GB04J01 TaxID=1485225 RepID=UPI000C9B81FA|nr:Na/Pi cotransporter family protein [Thalassospira sp. GB04J01]|tara:strand:- start:8511 stop:10298 length:1788 start_codon:yes stop_codon:yes gene_type:complete
MLPIFKVAISGTLLLVFLAGPAMAGEDAIPLQTGAMLIGLVGGLALFLYGMDHLASALKTLAGARLRRILSNMTRNRIWAALSGAVITGLVQSSSVTTVLVVGFVSAGLMPFAQAIAVIMGANMGSTLTAQIIAFRIEAIAPLFIAIGLAMTMLADRKRFTLIGKAVLGLGLLFFGMGMMSQAMEPLRSFQPFLSLMGEMSNPFMAILVAAAFTALVQSSAATMGIVIVLAGQGLVSLEGGIALIFGANIGTCVTALLGAIGKNRDGVRTAVGHILFNVIGVVIWLPFIDLLAGVVRGVTMGGDIGNADIAREIANAHSIFNIANVILMIGFVPLMARMIEKLVPLEKDIEPRLSPEPKYVIHNMDDAPAAAMTLLRNEVMHMGDIVIDVVRRGQENLRLPTRARLVTIAELDDGVDSLQDAIAMFAGKMRRTELLPNDINRLQNELAVSNHLEAIGDLVSEEMVRLVGEWFDLRHMPSEESLHKMAELYEIAEESLKQAMTAFSSEDAQAAQRVLDRKAEFAAKMDATLRKVSDEIGPRDIDIRRYRIEVAMVERINRLYERSRRISHVSQAIIGQREPSPDDQNAASTIAGTM